MKKSYRKKGYTSIALNPEMASRIEKMLKNSGGKLSKYAQGAINKELENDEMKQILSTYGKLDASDQYQKIKQLEGEVEKLKEYHITEKKISKQFKELKSKKIDDLEKRLEGFEKEKAEDEEISRLAEEHKHEMPEYTKDLDALFIEFEKRRVGIEKREWVRKGYTEDEAEEFEKEKQRILKKYKKKKK